MPACEECSGRKTDVQDSEWCAAIKKWVSQRQFHSSSRYSRAQRLTRHKRKLIQAITAEKQRVEKVGGCQYKTCLDCLRYLWGEWERIIEELIKGNWNQGDG